MKIAEVYCSHPAWAMSTHVDTWPLIISIIHGNWSLFVNDFQDAPELSGRLTLTLTAAINIFNHGYQCFR